jgi:hypothetical protein
MAHEGLDTGSAWHRAFRDAENFRNSSKWWFWGVDVLGSAALAAVTAALTISTLPNLLVGVLTFFTFVLGMVFIYGIIYLWNLFHAPYRQRNEARQIIEQLTKPIQSPGPKLPKEIVNKDQEKHLEDIGRYLEKLKESFPEIETRRGIFAGNIGNNEEELRQHLNNIEFWQNIDNYRSNASKASSIFKQLYQEIKTKAVQIAPLEKEFESQKQYITTQFIFSIFTSYSGEPWISGYKWDDGPQLQTLDGVIISKGIKSEAEHRNLVEFYKQEEKYIVAKDIIENLNKERKTILRKIYDAIQNKKYRYSFCSNCPLVISGYAKL